MNQLSDIIKGFNTTPFLFVGSGLTRRYFNLPDWKGLLNIFARKISDDDFSYSRFESLAKTLNPRVCIYSKIAELIENEFNKKWFADASMRRLDSYYNDAVKSGVSPFKAEVAMYIQNHSTPLEEYRDEIEKLHIISQKSISGIITTNYDCFLESIADQYNTYIGQEELVFSAIQGIAEIYKIHGCVTRPESLVINEADYLEFDDKSAYLAAKLMTIFLEYPIIFIGYSITDPDIQKILKSIVHCLSTENAKKLGERFIFVEYQKDFKGVEISQHTITFDNGKLIDMTKIKLEDFGLLYTALSEKKSKLPVKIFRMFKQEFYNFTLTNDPTAKLRVAGIDDPRVNDEDLVLAFGKTSEISLRGLKGLTPSEWYRDIVMNDIDFSANDILSIGYPSLITQTNVLPLNKHLSMATIDFPVYKQIAAANSFDKIISRSFQRARHTIHIIKRSVNDIVADYPEYKALYLIAHLEESEINIEDLEHFLKQIFTTNPGILESSETAYRTNLRRLIRIYDWMKYSSKVKEP